MLIEQWRERSAAWYLTWGICYEFLRVITHPRVLRQPWSGTAGLGFLDALAASPGLGMLVPTERHSTILRELAEGQSGIAGNLWHDAETAALMLEHGIRRICTRDTDFHRFKFLEAIDPLTSEP
jgi:predicted nucleic acid-binding protein